jgi:hypothetical protein
LDGHPCPEGPRGIFSKRVSISLLLFHQPAFTRLFFCRYYDAGIILIQRLKKEDPKDTFRLLSFMDPFTDGVWAMMLLTVIGDEDRP